MVVELTSREVSEKYDRFARWYDWLEGVPGLLGVSRLRRRLMQGAHGRVLEIAVGTEKNLAHYPTDCWIVALDLSGEMLKVAQNRAAKLSMQVCFLVADAEALPFRRDSFDTVVSSLSTARFPNLSLRLKRWREFVGARGECFYWSTVGVITSGSAAGRTATRISLQNRLAVIGTASHWTWSVTRD